MHKVFLGIGGNIGNKHNNFKKVVKFIEKELGEIIKNHRFTKLLHGDFDAKENFWNQVID